MNGYYAGVDECSESSDETGYEDETEQQPEPYDNDVPNTLIPQEDGFGPICNTLQIALYPSCSELVNPDGSLTPLGSDTIKCTISGAILSLGATALHIPPNYVIEGLSTLSEQTGCSGLVKIDQLSLIGNIKGIVKQLTKIVT